MAIKGLLLEMAVYGEAEVFAMNPVSTVLTEIVKNLEGDELRNYVSEEITSIPISNPLIQLTTSDIGIIIRHHCSGERPRKKAALLALPYVINANYVTRPWRHKVDKDGKPLKGKDARQSGMISAPIMIDGVKYLCNITQKQNINGIIRPYALTLKDADGNIIEGEKMDCTFQVPDSNNEHTTFGNAHISKVTTSPDTNPSMSTNITKNNNTNENKTYNNMKKNVQRINESQLRVIVAESVKKVLNEFQAGGNDWGNTYADYRQRNQTNTELDDVVTNLHTICQYMEDISNAVYNGQPSKYFSKCQPEYLEQAYELIQPIYGMMANRTNRRGDAQGLNTNEIKQECGQALKQLSQMQYLGVICNAARRACQELAI